MFNKDLLITEAYLCILIILMGSAKGSNIAELVGAFIGLTIIPLFNAHLTKKYLDFPIIKKYPLFAMLIVGTISLIFINAMMFLLGIVGAIIIDKIINKKSKVKTS